MHCWGRNKAHACRGTARRVVEGGKVYEYGSLLHSYGLFGIRVDNKPRVVLLRRDNPDVFQPLVVRIMPARLKFGGRGGIPKNTR